MRIVLLVLAVLVVGCGKSRCEKYAEMEIRCGGFPKSEEDMTRKLAEGMCESAEEMGDVGKHFAVEADCAAKHLGKDGADCHGYKQCVEASEAPSLGAPAPQGR
jgi:hypothetical protein